MSVLLSTVSTIFGKNKLKGDIGLEIEMEGRNLPLGALPPKDWVMHQDGSLRGESAEYVFNGPKTRDATENALNELKMFLKGSTLAFSPRTSVHVHVNATTMPILHVYNMICLYLLVEDVLIQFSGPERESNLFCLRFKDAEALLQMVTDGLENEQYLWNFDENNRYSSLNLSALRKFGSVEFRSMRGNLDKAFIMQWVDVLLRLRELSSEFENPRQIIREFSASGPKEFFARMKLPGLEFQNKYSDSMYEGMRLAQDIAFAHNWDTTVVSKKKDDPHPGLDQWQVDALEMVLRHDRHVRADGTARALVPEPAAGAMSEAELRAYRTTASDILSRQFLHAQVVVEFTEAEGPVTRHGNQRRMFYRGGQWWVKRTEAELINLDQAFGQPDPDEEGTVRYYHGYTFVYDDDGVWFRLLFGEDVG
jgi:hypothetical protein